jgi:aryl-alcohol dehydrogenase
MQIQAAVLEKPDGTLLRRRIRVETVELDGPCPDEVLVQVTSCGVCGTDRGCIHGLEPYPTPGVLGHEGAGVVEEVGREVTRVKPGDRVVMGFPFCGVCRNCRRGQPRYCEQGNKLMFGGYRLDGSSPLSRPSGEKLAGRFFQQSSWATHAIAQERQLAKVPEGIPHDLMGPLGCSLSTGAGTVLNELRPMPGASLAIFGAGAVGLAAVMAARLTGLTTIIAVDKAKHRLALARDLGAIHTLPADGRVVEAIRDLTGGGVDYAIESTNGANLVGEACAALGLLGVCAMVGGAKPTAQISLNHPDMLLHGKRLMGIMGGGGQTPDFQLALMRLQAEGRFPFEKLVRWYDFADINRAIDDSDAGEIVKPMLRMA